MSDETAGTADQIEREADTDDTDDARRAGSLDLEAPEADSAEQRTELLQQRDDPVTERPADRDGEANPADTAEQGRVAGVDDEDEDESRR